MLESKVKEIIGEEFYVVDANKLAVEKGRCMGFSVKDSGHLLMYMQIDRQHRSLDYRHVHKTKEQADTWLNEITPHVNEANRIVGEAQRMVDMIRENHIVGKPYLTL